MSDMLNIASSGLLAFQRAISTTSHNIANARTEGYSRQRVELQARPPAANSLDAGGNGTMVDGVERLHDGFATARVLESTSAHARETTHHALAARLDDLVADEGLGLAPALTSFYAAIEDAAAEPGSSAAREVVLAGADALAGRFGTLQSQLDATEAEVGDRLRAELEELNDLATGVAELNARIVKTRKQGRSEGANDLLDQRDRLVEKIAARVDVTPLGQDDGSLNLLVGNGTALVLGNRAHALRSVADATAAGQLRIEMDVGGGRRQSLGNTPLGGSIGGLQDFASETLEPVRHRLGRLALVSAEQLNTQHASGLDANGELGGVWFSSAEPNVAASSSNSGGATLDVAVTDVSALAASDYLLRWDGAAFDVTRRSDGQQSSATMPLSIDGLEITLSGAPAAGDTFVVSATGQAAGGFSNVLGGNDALALARALVAGDDPANGGDARLRQPEVLDREDPALRSAVDIVFTADDTYDVIERSSGTPLASGVSHVPGADIAFNGWRTALDGTPRAGDVHRIDANTDGVGDNGNALALVALQDERIVGGSDTTIADHANLVSFVGGRTRTLETRSGALETLRDDAIERAESVSGVNLDEEAIALTRYEQAYQASAQAIAVADSLFQSILGVVAR